MYQAFKPRCGVLRTTVGGFSPLENSLKFCASVSRGARYGDGAGSLRPDTLVYMLPRESGGAGPLQGGQAVLHLLVQLRAFYHQTNFFLQSHGTGRQMNRQLQNLSMAAPAAREEALGLEKTFRLREEQRGALDSKMQSAIRTLTESLKKKTVTLR